MNDSINKNFNHFKIHTQYSICEGAVKIDDKKVTDINIEISSNQNIILKVGKRKFLKIN